MNTQQKSGNQQETKWKMEEQSLIWNKKCQTQPQKDVNLISFRVLHENPFGVLRENSLGVLCENSLGVLCDNSLGLLCENSLGVPNGENDLYNPTGVLDHEDFETFRCLMVFDKAFLSDFTQK